MSPVMPQKGNSSTVAHQHPGWTDLPLKPVLFCLITMACSLTTPWPRNSAPCLVSDFIFFFFLFPSFSPSRLALISFQNPVACPAVSVSMATPLCGTVDSIAPLQLCSVAQGSALYVRAERSWRCFQLLCPCSVLTLIPVSLGSIFIFSFPVRRVRTKVIVLSLPL